MITLTSGAASQVKRLLEKEKKPELGLRIGCRLRMLQPGSPCMLQVGECRLCLGGEVAAQILVRPIAAGD